MSDSEAPTDRETGTVGAFCVLTTLDIGHLADDRGKIYAVCMLLDVSEIPMAELVTSDNAVLARCVDRILAGLDDPDGIISAFQSYVE